MYQPPYSVIEGFSFTCVVDATNRVVYDRIPTIEEATRLCDELGDAPHPDHGTITPFQNV